MHVDSCIKEIHQQFYALTEDESNSFQHIQ